MRQPQQDPRDGDAVIEAHRWLHEELPVTEEMFERWLEILDTPLDQPRHHFGHPQVENQRAGMESTLRGSDPIATRSRPLAIDMVHLEYVNGNS